MTQLCSEHKVGPILIVTPWYNSSLGGVAKVAESLHKKLTIAGVENYVLVCEELDECHKLAYDSSDKRVAHLNLATYFFNHVSVRTLAGTLIRGPLVLWYLSRFLRIHKVKTVLLLYPTGSVWPFLFLQSFVGIRLIVSCHGNEITKFEEASLPLRWLIRTLLQRSDAVIACADHLLRKVQYLVPKRRLRAKVIANCVDTSHFVPRHHLGGIGDPPALIHVSNFAPKKRTIDIIEAFASPNLPADTRLIMVGDGRDLRRAIERAKVLGVYDRVDFVGAQKDVRPYLWQARLFVLASDDEGAPLALLEAMASGLPWVSTAWGPAAVLPPGECGLVVPSRAPEELARAMAELLNNPQRSREMGMRARQRAERDFGEAGYVEKHLKLIQEVEAV